MTRILLIAYDFAPIESAQSIRWRNLTEQLVRHGFKISVITARLPGSGELASPIGNVECHKVYSGPFSHLASWILRATQRLEKKSPTAGRDDYPSTFKSAPATAKKVVTGVKRFLDIVLVPDARIEWAPFAVRKAKHLLSKHEFDFVIASHEPSISLFVAAVIQKRAGCPVVADLGDPVVTPFTHRFRRPTDLFLEKKLLRRFKHLTVTTSTARAELIKRCGLEADQISVITQAGSVGRATRKTGRFSVIGNRASKVHVGYFGNFYPDFRDPRVLFEAISSCPEVTLHVFGSSFTPPCRTADNVLLYPRISYDAALAMQKKLDLLVSVGNTMSEQVPGKTFEYICSGRPVLYLYQNASDPVIGLFHDHKIGVALAYNSTDLKGFFNDLIRNPDLLDDLKPSEETQSIFSWEARGVQYRDLLYSIRRGACARTDS